MRSLLNTKVIRMCLKIKRFTPYHNIEHMIALLTWRKGCWHGRVDQFWHRRSFFFCIGCDYKCYILLHMLGLVNRDSFSNNRL
jgi:hypothetical protein